MKVDELESHRHAHRPLRRSRFLSLNYVKEIGEWSGFLACVSYCFLSTTITLFNKAVFSIYKFNYPAFLTLSQVFLSLVFLFILRVAGIVDLGPRLSWTTRRSTLLLAFLWMIYVQSGVMALRHLTVPMFAVLRRSTVVFVAAGQWAFLRKKTSHPCLFAISCMLVGTFIAGVNDLSFSFQGYTWMSICVLSTAAYLIMISYQGNHMKLNQAVMLFYNNLFSLPMLLAWFFLATDEPLSVLQAPQWRDGNFPFFLLLSASQAFVLNMCIFWCTTVNSPMATTVTGQLKDVFTTTFGLFMFGDVFINSRNVAGLFLGLAGGIAYSYFSLKKS